MMMIKNFIRFICIKITFTSLGHRTLQLEFPFVEAYLEKEKKKFTFIQRKHSSVNVNFKTQSLNNYQSVLGEGVSKIRAPFCVQLQ